MPYPKSMVAPMRKELTRLGADELKTPDAVDAAFADPDGTMLLVINSVCGCAAGSARPAVAKALASEADAPLAEMDAAPADADVEVHLGAAPPVLDRETLERLDEMSAGELDALEVGAVRLRDDGTVAALNDAALRLPELRTVEDRAAVVGEHFFRDLVPSTNTALFVDRVRAGQRRGELDARFPFTFAGPDEAPRSFAVHLYRSPDRDATWLLFRPS